MAQQNKECPTVSRAYLCQNGTCETAVLQPTGLVIQAQMQLLVDPLVYCK